MTRKGILVIAPFFRPSVGGAESYIDDIVGGLDSIGCDVFVHAYQPIIKSVPLGPSYEVSGSVRIFRYRWIGGDIFHKFSKFPAFIFAYITPYLFLRIFFWMLINHKKISVIDGQGLNACFIAKIIALIFQKERVSTVLALYDFRRGALFTKLSAWALKGSKHVILEKGLSFKQVELLGYDPKKIISFFWWVNENLICNLSRSEARKNLGLDFENKFLVLFVGRAIEIKGADIVLGLVERFPNIQFAFVTNNSGYCVDEIKRAQTLFGNVSFIGEVPYELLHTYYRAANILCVPSRYDENAALVVSEAISNGTPVIVSNRGSLPEMVSPQVGLLAEPNSNSFAESLALIYSDSKKYDLMVESCMQYANEVFGKKNREKILNAYID